MRHDFEPAGPWRALALAATALAAISGGQAHAAEGARSHAPSPCRIEGSAPEFHQDAIWSPDGSRIAFSTYVPETEQFSASNWRISVADADCTGRRRIVADAQFVTWSPDGERLAFSSSRDGDRDLYIVSISAPGEPLQITFDDHTDTHPAWSPDGGKIAFASDRAGTYDIYVLTLRDRSIRQLTRDPLSDDNPQWSPDGKRLVFFRSQQGQNDRIMIADLAKGQEYEPPQSDTHNTFPSFLPGGDAILYTAAEPSARPNIVMTDLASGETALLAKNAFFGRASPDGARLALISGRWPSSTIELRPAPRLQITDRPATE